MPPATKTTYSALIDVITPNDPKGASLEASRFETEYSGYEPDRQQAVVDVLNVVETAAPGGPFSQLSVAQRAAFVNAQMADTRIVLTLGATVFRQAIDAHAEDIRQAALLGPRGLAQLTAAPGEDGPLVLTPTPLTGYVPDFDQDFLQAEEPPAETPAAPTPLTNQQFTRLTIRAGIELSREPFIPIEEETEDLGDEPTP